MRIVGRDGLVLNDAWKEGADAYLGITVPGFPNFFMLYGPNTNLGHNSIVFMLESQVAHVMRCLRALRAAGAAAIEVDAERHRRFNAGVRQRLARTVWNGCKSWYVDQAGRNSINWPGFTVTYRWLARRSSLAAYTLSRPCAGKDGGELIAAPGGLAERFNAGMVRLLLRTCFRPFAGPPWGIGVQRAVSAMLSLLAPGVGGVGRARMSANGVPVDIVTPASQGTQGAILYIHGGAFVLGSPAGHRSMTSRLAVSSGMPVWVPDYRLAPEHPYPAALDDVRACYEAMLAQGLRADQIVIGGDSAGGALALALAILLKQLGAAQPAGLLLVSPVTDPALAGATMQSLRGDDPMVRQGWVEQALRWYACPPQEMTHRPLEADLAGLAPMLIQAGEQEVLLADSTRLAAHAASCGVPCKLEVYAGRWHVFHLSAFFLESANHALRRLARFARECVDNAAAASAAPAMKGNQP
jgi:acetyl esterase/lipase